MAKIPITRMSSSAITPRRIHCRREKGNRFCLRPLIERCWRGDNAAADQWALENQAEYMAGGMHSGITGNRADGLVIDDPLKGREDADSAVIRDKTWEAYLSDLRTRLKPNGFIIMILTRWHEDDPAGRILPEDYNGETGWVTARDGEQWYVLSLQAECERADDPLGRKIGDYIWPGFMQLINENGV